MQLIRMSSSPVKTNESKHETSSSSSDDESDSSVEKEVSTNAKNTTTTTTTTKNMMTIITLSENDLENAVASVLNKTRQSKSKSQHLGHHQNNEKMKINEMKNELTELIPGYVAPMSLDSSSLDPYKQNIVSSTKHATNAITIGGGGITAINTNPSDFQSKNFKMAKRDPSLLVNMQSNAGSKWFGFEATPNSASLQADIALIRNRNYIDPKKFYKSSDFGKKGDKRMVQLGTVIEGSMESIFTNRLSKKQRRSNLVEEVMGEVFQGKNDYVKKKFTAMQRETTVAAKRRTRILKKGGIKKGRR
jgi:hypothetical protein